ncbi:hypothetical protein AX17_005584 [Amanita inopinata Kibby_2008]|nr:hypothetical protein AX17_005584 [Amanita inopinata Kibby_2008]
MYKVQLDREYYIATAYRTPLKKPLMERLSAMFSFQSQPRRMTEPAPETVLDVLPSIQPREKFRVERIDPTGSSKNPIPVLSPGSDDLSATNGDPSGGGHAATDSRGSSIPSPPAVKALDQAERPTNGVVESDHGDIYRMDFPIDSEDPMTLLEFARLLESVHGLRKYENILTHNCNWFAYVMKRTLEHHYNIKYQIIKKSKRIPPPCHDMENMDFYLSVQSQRVTGADAGPSSGPTQPNGGPSPRVQSDTGSSSSDQSNMGPWVAKNDKRQGKRAITNVPIRIFVFDGQIFGEDYKAELREQVAAVSGFNIYM